MEGDLVEKDVGQSVRARLSAACCRGSSICRRAHQRKWLYYKLFPNVAFDIYPDQVDFMQFLPVSATETVIREISYALPDERREMKAARYLNWRINRRVNAEDTELITRVQLGMQSPSYVAGAAGDERSVPAELRAEAQAADPGGAAGVGRRRRAGAALRIEAVHDGADRAGRRRAARAHHRIGFEPDAVGREGDEQDADRDDQPLRQAPG